MTLTGIVLESGRLPGIVTITDKVSKFSSGLYKYCLHEWTRVLTELRTDITIQEHIRLLFAIVNGYSISYAGLSQEFVESSLPYRANLITIDENNIPQLYIRSSTKVIEDTISLVSPKDDFKMDSESAVGNIYEFMVLKAFTKCEISMVALNSKDMPTSFMSFNLIVGYGRASLSTTIVNNKYLYHFGTNEFGADCLAFINKHFY